MPRQLDQRIADILRKYGEDPSDTKTVLWDCHGTWVVYHAAVERIAARAGVVFDMPQILRAERDEAVILVSASLGERKDWDIGECLVGTNYKVSGRQSAYVWAMASKRARDRVVLKLAGLHGLIYSEDEADDFRDSRPRLVEPEPEPDAGPLLHDLGAITVNGQVSAYAARKEDLWTPLVEGLRACETVEEMQVWKGVNTAVIGKLPPLWRDALREEWTKHVDGIRGGDDGEA
jgi:hypothetical protein